MCAELVSTVRRAAQLKLIAHLDAHPLPLRSVALMAARCVKLATIVLSPHKLLQYSYALLGRTVLPEQPITTLHPVRRVQLGVSVLKVAKRMSYVQGAPTRTRQGKAIVRTVVRATIVQLVPPPKYFVQQLPIVQLVHLSTQFVIPVPTAQTRDW